MTVMFCWPPYSSSASTIAVSVLPTPLVPASRNTPIGVRGSVRLARDVRIDWAMRSRACDWPTICRSISAFRFSTVLDLVGHHPADRNAGPRRDGLADGLRVDVQRARAATRPGATATLLRGVLSSSSRGGCTCRQLASRGRCRASLPSEGILAARTLGLVRIGPQSSRASLQSHRPALVPASTASLSRPVQPPPAPSLQQARRVVPRGPRPSPIHGAGCPSSRRSVRCCRRQSSIAGGVAVRLRPIRAHVVSSRLSALSGSWRPEM